MKEGINGANSYPPPGSSGLRERWGISKQLREPRQALQLHSQIRLSSSICRAPG